jgi:hypothetical protein
MEQFVRDARINQIYEGANGVQAMDLVGRKLGLNGGRPIKSFGAEVEGYLREHAKTEALAPYVTALGAAISDLQQAALWLAKQGASDPDALGAGADDFLNLFGLVALGYMWCRMTEVATAKLAAAPGSNEGHLRGKLVVGRFFVEKMLPETAFLLARIKTGAATVMALPEEAF